MTFTPGPRRGRVNHERTTRALIATPAPIPAPPTRTTPTPSSPASPPDVDTAVLEEPSIDDDDEGGRSLPGCPVRALTSTPPPRASQTASPALGAGVLGSRSASVLGEIGRAHV